MGVKQHLCMAFFTGILHGLYEAKEIVFTSCMYDIQTSFRKPSLNVYCLDYSGSMYGEGNEQLVEIQIS